MHKTRHCVSLSQSLNLSIPQSSDQFELAMVGIGQLLLAPQFEQHGNALAGDRLELAFNAIQRRVFKTHLLAGQRAQFSKVGCVSLILKLLYDTQCASFDDGRLIPKTHNGSHLAC
jgi:hypothetical protein